MSTKKGRPECGRAAIQRKSIAGTDTTSQAHSLQQKGFHVFPVDHPAQPRCVGKHRTCDGQRGKHPAVAWGTWAATNTPQMIESGWAKCGGLANVGIACGPSNLVVLDEDQAGEVDRWCADHRLAPLPPTYTVTTGRGRHLYYRWDHAALRIGNTVKLDGFKIDVRGDGGYVVAEGSQHASGTVYEGNGQPVAALPAEVAELLPTGSPTPEPHKGIVIDDDKHLGPIRFGERHHKLVAYAGRLRNSGLTRREVESTFRQRWLDCEQPEGQIPEARFHSAACQYPVTWDEAQAKLADVFGRYPAGRAPEDGGEAGISDDFVLTLTPANEIVSDIPYWAWEYDGLGRIQRGVLTLFAGRPGAGKSSGARWFAAQFSTGKLDGCWKNNPQKVAYIASEEQLDFVVKPGLQVAGANMGNIVFPEVTFNGESVALMSDRDEAQLTKELVAQGVKVIVVDPIMATIRRKVDIYRNNELREALEPWIRIARKLNGIVVGIVHLTKGNNGDVVAAINGSSGFGEVARCVFGFAKDGQSEDGECVMSQVKNSCGVEDLSLAYMIEVKQFTADTGRTGPMGVFTITGDSDTTVSEIMATTGSSKLRPAMQRVLDFVNGRDETSPQAVVDAHLAKNNKQASKMLKRLADHGHIDSPMWGFYTPKLAAGEVAK